MERQFTYNIDMFKETFESEFTFMNGFLRNVRRFANRPALTDPIRGKTWTYAELNKDVNKLAHALLEDDVDKNEVVMYQLLNSAEFIYSYLAPQKIGAVNCTINFRLSPGKQRLLSMTASPLFSFMMQKSKILLYKLWKWRTISRAVS